MSHLKIYHYLLICIVAVFSVANCYTFIMKKNDFIANYDENNTKIKIQTLQKKIEQIKLMPQLPPIVLQWKMIESLSNKYHIQLSASKSSINDFYKGALYAWNGRLIGPTGYMLAAINEMQEKVPMYVYLLKVNGSQTVVTFSVIGSEE